MPAVIPLAVAAVSAGASVYGAKSAGKTARRAATTQRQSDDDAIALERERDAEAKRQWDATGPQNQREFAAAEEERSWRRNQEEYQRRLAEERETRLQPYRQASAAALGNLGKMLGINLSQQQQAMTAPRMPQGGAPGQPPLDVGRDGLRTGWGPRPDMPPVSGPVVMPQDMATLGDMIRLQPQRRLG